jgi:hypothetical protein
MTMTPPKRVRPNDPVRAEDHNSIVEYLEQLTRLRLGTGLSGRFDAQGGLQLALAFNSLASNVHPAIILRVNGSATTPTGPIVASGVVYTAGVIGRFSEPSPGVFTGQVLSDVLPAYGRQVKGPEADVLMVRPAEVGSFCLIITTMRPEGEGNPVGELCLIPGGTRGETPYAESCSAS